jgi:hypothetical protein
MRFDLCMYRRLVQGVGNAACEIDMDLSFVGKGGGTLVWKLGITPSETGRKTGGSKKERCDVVGKCTIFGSII